MSRSNHHGKRCGKEFWSRRPMRYAPQCKWSKQKCHRIERMQAIQLVNAELQNL